MPVGTAGTVKAMTADAVRATGASIVLGNTYHLMLRPGAERIARLGGLHRFMDWPGPILTDSGGFQVMSLAKLRKLDADGVTFQSHLDGSHHRLTPARSIEIQHLLDATITMVLDECTAVPATPDEARASMQLSMRWAARSREAFRPRGGYGLFGIVQGSVYPDLREASAHALLRDRLRRLCDRRTGDRRRPGHDLRRARRHRAASAGGCAALPDGCGHAGRHHRRGAARHRHVRLRDADPRRPHRARLHLRRRVQSAQRALRRRRRAARPGLRLPGLHAPQPRLSALICSRPRKCWDRCCSPGTT